MGPVKEVEIAGVLGVAAWVFRRLPLKISLAVGRYLGQAGYYLFSKKRAVVYSNLKTAFSKNKSPQQLQVLTRSVFVNLTQSFVELLCMSNIKRGGFENFVHLQGKENVDEAIHKGKGVIFLAIHSGNWELGNILNSQAGYTYNIVANQQPKMPQLDILLDECRQMAGAHIIAPGVATKEIIKALKRNEIVGLVLDQGGEEGVPVNFFGKTTSMSSGAIRLALKYGCALCPAWIVRKPDGTHLLKFFPALDLIATGDLEKDIQTNVQMAVSHYEDLLREHPEEYLWFYKVFKYTKDAQIVILDDGKSSHLQKAQESSREIRNSLANEGKLVKENTVKLDFRSSFKQKIFPLYAFLSRSFQIFRNEVHLKFFLTDRCYASLMSLKADFIISCGPQSEGLNFILSKNHQAKGIALIS